MGTSKAPADGRYRPHLHTGNGMYAAVAYRQDSNIIRREIYGADFGLFKGVVYFNREADAQRKCDRLNVRLLFGSER
jgi:hypothetical protein